MFAYDLHTKKMQIPHAVSDRGIGGGAAKQKKMIRRMMNMNHTHILRNDTRSQLQLKIRNTRGHEVPGNIPSGNTASCRGNKRWPQQASTAKPRGTGTSWADFTSAPLLLPIDIDNQRHCCLLLLAETLLLLAV